MTVREKTTYILSDEEDEIAGVIVSTSAQSQQTWKTPLFAHACDDICNLAMASCCPIISVSKLLSVFGIATYRTAILAGVFWSVLFLLSVLNVATQVEWPNSSFALGFLFCLPLVPVLTLFNLRYQAREYHNIPKSDLEDFCCSIWCYPFVLAQLSIEVELNTPGKCEFEDNATLIAYTTA